MTAIDIKPNLHSIKESHLGSPGLANISIASKSKPIDQRAVKYTNEKRIPNSGSSSPVRKGSNGSGGYNEHRRHYSDGKGSPLDKRKANSKTDLRRSDFSPVNYRAAPGSPRRLIEKRLSLSTSTSLQARSSRGHSLPDGKIITQMNGRKMSEEELSSSRGTPTGNRRLKYTKLQKNAERRVSILYVFQIFSSLITSKLY